MKTSHLQDVDSSKTAPIALLFVQAGLILLAGAAFSVYSALEDVAFTVLGSTIPGYVFGILVMFLGVRYLLSVRKLRTEVYKGTSRFSWENFKSDKARQRR
jgi:hypothetical protein